MLVAAGVEEYKYKTRLPIILEFKTRMVVSQKTGEGDEKIEILKKELEALKQQNQANSK